MRLKRIAVFLVCVLFAFVLWLIHNLSKEYASYFRYNIEAVSSLEGRTGQARANQAILVKGMASGFYILKTNRRHIAEGVLTIEVPPNLLLPVAGHKDTYCVSVMNLQESIANAVAGRVKLESIHTDTLYFMFPKQSFRKVPVKMRLEAGYAPQYTSFDTCRLSPDSVLIYGPAELIEKVSFVPTEYVHFENLRETVQGIAHLEAAAGMRCTPMEVKYELAVERYVEAVMDMELEAIGVPRSATLITVPDHVAVRVQYPFRLASQYNSDNFRLAVFYTDVLGSLSGKVLPKLVRCPQWVRVEGMEPAFVNCIIQ